MSKELREALASEFIEIAGVGDDYMNMFATLIEGGEEMTPLKNCYLESMEWNKDGWVDLVHSIYVEMYTALMIMEKATKFSEDVILPDVERRIANLDEDVNV
jgi:hypothetical protein